MNTEMPYRSCLDLFVGCDDLRPGMKTPFFQDEYVYATDAHAVIVFDKSFLEIVNFDSHPKAPNARSVIPSGENINIQLKVDLLINKLNKNESDFNKSYTESKCKCPDCYGYGNVDYTFYDHQHKMHELESECPTCDGSGVLEMTVSNNTNQPVEGANKYIQINDSFFNPDYIQKMVNTARMHKVDCIYLVHKNNASSVFKFRVGECIICIMPMLKPENKEDCIITKVY